MSLKSFNLVATYLRQTFFLHKARFTIYLTRPIASVVTQCKINLGLVLCCKCIC